MARRTSAIRTLLTSCFLSALLGCAVGCASATGGRLGTVESWAEVATQIATEVKAEVKAEVQAVAAAIAVQPDQSNREAAAGAGARIDQSTADKWLSRLQSAGTAVALILSIYLSYPLARRRRQKREARFRAEKRNQ